MAGLAEQLAERLAERGVSPKGEEVREEETQVEGESQETLGEEADSRPGDDVEGESQDTLEMITDLAKYLDVEPETLYNLKVKPDNGDPITLGELKDKAQEYTRQREEWQAQLAQLEQERAQLFSGLQGVQQAGAQLSEEGSRAWQDMQMAEFQYNKIDWPELEKIDPGRAALERQKLLQQHASAKKRLERANAEHEQLIRSHQWQAKQYHDAELLKRIPQWKDPAIAEREIGEIVTWMRQTYNFNDHEIMSAVDWRMRDVLRKAHAFDAMNKKASGNGVAAKPMVLGRGSALGSKERDRKRVSELITKARSGSKQDKIEAAKAILDRSFAKR